jgi:hypothetical protein
MTNYQQLADNAIAATHWIAISSDTPIADPKLSLGQYLAGELPDLECSQGFEVQSWETLIAFHSDAPYYAFWRDGKQVPNAEIANQKSVLIEHGLVARL